MSEFLKMDIFFFIATIGVLVFICLGAYILWRVARILKHVEHVSEQIALESDNVRQDLAGMRGEIRAGKSAFKSLFGFLKKSTQRTPKSSKE